MLSNNTYMPVARFSVYLSSFAMRIGESGSTTDFLPMACSYMGPMTEVLGDAGIYFDPEDAVALPEHFLN